MQYLWACEIWGNFMKMLYFSILLSQSLNLDSFRIYVTYMNVIDYLQTVITFYYYYYFIDFQLSRDSSWSLDVLFYSMVSKTIL